MATGHSILKMLSDFLDRWTGHDMVLPHALAEQIRAELSMNRHQHAARSGGLVSACEAMPDASVIAPGMPSTMPVEGRNRTLPWVQTNARGACPVSDCGERRI